MVVIYLAGHGSPDPDRPEDYYLLTHDSEAVSYPGTAISMEDVNLYVRQLRARDIIVLTDACHSAAVSGNAVGLRGGEPNAINEMFLERIQATAAGLFSFTASETNQFSQESDRWGGGHGVFTYQLLRGLEGEADGDGDGIVSLGEIVEFTRFAVQRDTRGAQVPFVGSGSFDRSWPMAITDPRAVTDLGAEALPSQLPVAESSEPAVEAMATVGLMSPVGVFAHSLLIPGSGQFRTKRGWRGGLVLAGSVGAVAYGLFSKTVTRQCREATVNGECMSGQFTSTETERPDLVASLAAAGALTVIGAVDALLGAKSMNRERVEVAVTEREGPVLALFPPHPSGPVRPGDLSLLELRFR